MGRPPMSNVTPIWGVVCTPHELGGQSDGEGGMEGGEGLGMCVRAPGLWILETRTLGPRGTGPWSHVWWWWEECTQQVPKVQAITGTHARSAPIFATHPYFCFIRTELLDVRFIWTYLHRLALSVRTILRTQMMKGSGSTMMRKLSRKGVRMVVEVE